jgi:hypothetical protein
MLEVSRLLANLAISPPPGMLSPCCVSGMGFIFSLAQLGHNSEILR